MAQHSGQDRPRKRLSFANPNEQLAELLLPQRAGPIDALAAEDLIEGPDPPAGKLPRAAARGAARARGESIRAIAAAQIQEAPTGGASELQHTSDQLVWVLAPVARVEARGIGREGTLHARLAVARVRHAGTGDADPGSTASARAGRRMS
jgi:hypothetical protein